jgi:hypothetical protein
MRDGDINQEDIPNNAIRVWRAMPCYRFALTWGSRWPGEQGRRGARAHGLGGGTGDGQAPRPRHCCSRLNRAVRTSPFIGRVAAPGRLLSEGCVVGLAERAPAMVSQLASSETEVGRR